ncbi:hypothetical protein T07_2078 [Trichinella nelsoni]|uniref:Uncharacterized protein n=1 Tax=Trichinella nelsoni TaxID=6336 RepID=A0A0V0RJR6_9BILA|nr:hypothetical protein T07_2078 [Trichinella nelsoni]
MKSVPKMTSVSRESMTTKLCRPSKEPSCNGNVTKFRGFTSSPDAVSKTTSQADIFLSQLIRDSRFLQIKLIVEPESNKILALYPPTTP